MPRRPFAPLPVAGTLARVPMLPACPREPLSPAADPLLIEGMFLASRQAGAAAAGPRKTADPERPTATLRGYEIRARSRPTPHGVFAGVALARFADAGARLHLGAGHRARSNPSPGWLAAVCAQVLEDPGVLPLLTFTASNLVTRRGQRLETEQQATTGETGPQRITVRATDATTLIMQVCRSGATVGDVFAQVTRRWPAVPQSLVAATVRSLVRGGFLLTDLLPDDVGDDPLGHLLSKLAAASSLRPQLSRLRRLLAAADRSPPGDPARMAALAAARDVADQIFFCERPLSVDVAADADLVLPSVLADDAVAAAGVLWQIGQGSDLLTAWHDRFLARYGPHRFVPLLEVTDPATGLGIDAPGPEINHLPRKPGRAAALAALLAQATEHGGTEVVLDAPTIAALASDQTLAPPPRTAEVYVRVLAATEQDLADGKLFLAVCPAAGSQDAGSTSGRFAALIPGAPAAYDTQPSALVAELAIRPRAPHAAALARRTGFATCRIPVRVPPEKGDLDLEDLLLASDGGHLIAWSASRDQQVIPVLYARLAPRLLPPLARFLQLLGHAGCRPWQNWSWGPLGDGPFQPRVRCGRTVLAPARWVLPPALMTAARHQRTWDEALRAWRAGTVPEPPDIVLTEDHDRRLPLDLRQQHDCELFRRYVRRGLRAVSEQPGGPDAVQAVVTGPAGRHVLELVVPLARNIAVPVPSRPARAPVRATGAGLHLPGGQWLSLAVRSPASCHDEVLASLAAAAGLAGGWDRWFWLRYHDAARGPHVRARFHGHPASLTSHLLPAISAWCSDMIRQRLSGGFAVEPYDQEIERYGGPDSIGAAEQVFAADSHLALMILAATADPDQRLVMAALSAAAIARTVADGDPAALRGRHVDRAARKRLAALRPHVRSAGQPEGIWPGIVAAADPAWVTRQDALAAYRDTLQPEQTPSCASALIHMHANRLLGGTSTEPLARALAADLLALP